jgi:hypothetical protein
MVVIADATKQLLLSTMTTPRCDIYILYEGKMNMSFKIVLAAIILSLAHPVLAEWEILTPAGELFYDYAKFEAVGNGEPKDTATIKIKYQIDEKWHVAYETDITVNEKGRWETRCRPPLPTRVWPVAAGPNPTPYRIEIYERKTHMRSNDFTVVTSKKKRP